MLPAHLVAVDADTWCVKSISLLLEATSEYVVTMVRKFMLMQMEGKMRV